MGGIDAGEVQGEPTRGEQHGFHDDAARRTAALGRTVIAANWRHAEWDGGYEVRELPLRAVDPREWRTRVADAAQGAPVAAGAAVLRAALVPKPGAANRPRALWPAGEKSKERAALPRRPDHTPEKHENPPSTGTTVPVTNAEASLTR